MWSSVQTVRGCPKHCSFCSVWRTDGQKPRQRAVDAVIREVVALRRKGFRFILLADDNFYPVTLEDLATADRRADKSRFDALTALRRERFDLMAQLEQLPNDMVFYTQITMEAAEDPEFLAAMRRARIKGALVGVESVTPEGLKAVYKDFNMAGDALVTRLQAFRSNGCVRARLVHLRPPDRHARDVRRDSRSRPARRRVVRAIRHTDAVPSTVDFAKWERESVDGPSIDGIRMTTGSSHRRPKVYRAHIRRWPPMRSGRGRRGCRIGLFARSGSARRACAPSARGSHSCSSRSCTCPADVRHYRDCDRQRPCRALGHAPAGSPGPRAGYSSPPRCPSCRNRLRQRRIGEPVSWRTRATGEPVKTGEPANEATGDLANR